MVGERKGGILLWKWISSCSEETLLEDPVRHLGAVVLQGHNACFGSSSTPANKHTVKPFPDMLKMIRQLGQHQRRRSLTPYNPGTRACVAPRAIRIRFHPRRSRHRQQGVRQPRVEVTPQQWHAANISGSGCTVLVHPFHGPKPTGHVRPEAIGFDNHLPNGSTPPTDLSCA